MVKTSDKIFRAKLSELEQIIELIYGSACLVGPDNVILFQSNIPVNATKAQSEGTLMVAQAQSGGQAQLACSTNCKLLADPAADVDASHQAKELNVIILGKYRVCRACNPNGEVKPGQADLYKSVVEKQSELICRIDLAGQITFANGAFCAFMGKDESELYKNKLQNLVTKGSVSAIDRALSAKPELVDHSKLELNIRQSQGTSRCTRWSIRPVEDQQGKLTGLQLTGRDITTQKVYYEELLKYQEQLRNLTGRLIMTEEIERRRIAQGLHDGIGHNLAQASLMLGKAISSGGKADRKKIISESLELISTANESARSLTFELSPPILFDVGFVAALEWLAGQIQNRHGITVNFSDDGVPKSVDDEVRVLLYHSVRELLINVVKHAEATLAEVTFSSDGNNTVLVVQDNGRGFDPGTLTRSDYEHSGYGHFTIVERVSQLSGQVEIISSPGKGTKVTITTPQGTPTKGPAAVATQQRHPGLRKAPDQNSITRVMLVDDHEIMRNGLKLLLDDHEGIEVVAEACDGKVAVDLAISCKPDVIVMDINMPNLGGIDATRLILEKLPDTRVIALSMHHDKNYIKDAFQAGAIAYLLKDSVHDDLVHAIRTASSSLRFISDKVFNRIMADFTSYLESSVSDKLAILSNREREVLGFIADGMTTKAIALRLGLSSKTIETYRRRITEKLHLDSVAELTKYALREGLTNMPG